MKADKEKKKDGNLEKVQLKKYIFSTFWGEAEWEWWAQQIHHPKMFTNSSQLKQDTHVTVIEEDMLSTDEI